MATNRIINVTAFFLLICLMSCARVNYSPGGQSMAKSHEVIAILNPNVLLDFNGQDDKVDEITNLEALNLQAEIYDWLQRRTMENKLSVNIMDINESNKLLGSINKLTLSVMKSNEICKLLKVDAILSSNFVMSKPVSSELATAFGVLAQVDLPTNKIKATMALHDGNTSDVIWNFSKEIDGSVGSSYKELMDKVLKKAVKKIPYYNKKFKMTRDAKIDLSKLEIN